MSSYITLPAEHVRNMCRAAAKGIERYREKSCEDSIQEEAERRMNRWFFKPKTLDDAIAAVKRDREFMNSFEMRLNRIHAHEAYDRILDLGYAAKALMETYKIDCPPVQVDVRDMAAIDTWKDVK